MSSATVRLLRLFVTSYAPLMLILAVQHSADIWPPGDGPAFWGLALVGLAGLIDAYRLPRGALRKGRVRVHLSDIADEGGEVAAYVATYLLPFVGFQIAGWRNALALLIYFGVLLVVFLRSDLALVNPALYLTGWRVVSAKRDDQRVLVLVPKNASVSAGDAEAVTFGRFLVYHSKV